MLEILLAVINGQDALTFNADIVVDVMSSQSPGDVLSVAETQTQVNSNVQINLPHAVQKDRQHETT